MQEAASVTPDHLTTSGAARVLGVAEGTVRLMERRGELPAIRLSSGMRVFSREDVERIAVERQTRRDSRGDAA